MARYHVRDSRCAKCVNLGRLVHSVKNGAHRVAVRAAGIAAGAGYPILEAIAAAGFRHQYSYGRNYKSDLGVTYSGMFQGGMIDSPLAHLMNTVLSAGHFLSRRSRPRGPRC